MSGGDGIDVADESVTSFDQIIDGLITSVENSIYHLSLNDTTLLLQACYNPLILFATFKRS